MRTAPGRRRLAVLTELFALRVLGQALVEFFSVDWLPPSEHWASGLLPYPVLLTVQLAILAIMVEIVGEARSGGGFFTAPRRRFARFLVVCSGVYAAAMALRYVLTMIFLPEMRWLGGVIPIFFHFVLAGFLYSWAQAILRNCAVLAERDYPPLPG